MSRERVNIGYVNGIDQHFVMAKGMMVVKGKGQYWQGKEHDGCQRKGSVCCQGKGHDGCQRKVSVYCQGKGYDGYQGKWSIGKVKGMMIVKGKGQYWLCKWNRSVFCHGKGNDGCQGKGSILAR